MSKPLYVATVYWRNNDPLFSVAGYDSAAVNAKTEELMRAELAEALDNELVNSDTDDPDEEAIKDALADELCWSGVNKWGMESLDALGIDAEHRAELETDGITTY